MSMKKVFDYATVLHKDNVIMVVYGVKPHGGIGIQVYPELGSEPIKSGKIVSYLRNLIDELKLPVNKFDSSNLLKDTGLLGQHVIKELKEKY